MQVGLSETSYVPFSAALWDFSDMADFGELRGRELYDELMRYKPSTVSEGDWAVQAGLNRGWFSDLKAKDTRPRIDTVNKLLVTAEKLHASPQPDLPRVRSASEDDGTVELIRLDLSVPMGPGTLVEDYVEHSTVKFDVGFLRSITRSSFSRLRIVDGVGDSMSPTMTGGDVIIVDTSDRALTRQDGIYWINIYGAAGLKRLRAVSPTRILIKSDNQTVDDYEIDSKDVRIEGRVVAFFRQV